MPGLQIFKLSDRAADLGLACNRNGLDLAGVPLLYEERGRYRPRPSDHIAKLLTRAYQTPIEPERLNGGLQVIATALNEGAVTRAMIAALWLRLPPLDWDGAARIALADEALGKYDPSEPRDWHGRWITGGTTAPISSDAPLPGGIRPVRSPHHGRPVTERHLPLLHPATVEENGDTGAAAARDTPERPSVASIRPGVSHHGLPGAERHNPLLRPTAGVEEGDAGRDELPDGFTDLPREYRLQIYEGLRSRLKDIDPGNPQLESLTSPDYSPSQADVDALTDALQDAQERAGEFPATDWELGWGARGVALEMKRLAGTRILPPNAPVIDDFPYGVAVSIKSIDLNAPWYRNPVMLSYKIDRYVDKLVGFDGLRMGRSRINSGEIDGKVLDIVVPIKSGTPAQMRAVNESRDRAARLGVHILINYY